MSNGISNGANSLCLSHNDESYSHSIRVRKISHVYNIDDRKLDNMGHLVELFIALILNIDFII